MIEFVMERDDMIFKSYIFGGWQCKMETKKGTISVRCGGHGLFINEQGPYEVWYPDKDSPTGYQTADDIWNYIKNNEPKDSSRKNLH